jgi:hypothetical protein
MLIRELAQRASSLQAMLPLKAPLQAHEWNSFPQSWFVPGNWFFNVNNPNWGNNAEASSSTRIRVPRLQLLSQIHHDEQLAPTGQALQADPQHIVTMAGQSISEIGDGPCAVPLVEGMDKTNDSADAVSGSVLPLDTAPPISTPSPQHHKRKTKARTPVVEDEVRRSTRLRRNADAVHIQLEN